MTARDPNLEPLDAWLARAASGARDVLADYSAERFNVHLRGSAYPVDTESLEREYLGAQFQTHCSIPLWLKSCKRCKGSKPETKEFCDPCQQKEWNEEEECRTEERARARFEHMQRQF